MSVLANVTVLNHPLVQHKLTLLRRKDTATSEFRRLMRELSLLMAYEVTRDLVTETVAIETPLEATDAPLLAGKKLCFLSILRAGNGMLDGMLDLVPSARVGHIGLYRDPDTLVPIEYYLKLPDDVQERLVIVVDPMVATGHSAVAAVSRLKQAGVSQISFACLIAAPEGMAVLAGAHPDLPVYAAAIDRQLDDHGYIRPGLGDAGDRLYGTR
jgi:uracil phosphoribosyltransferase